MSFAFPSALRLRLSPAVGWRRFFSEEYFWKEANVGPFFICLLASPWIWSGIKDAYWTRQMRSLTTTEIISGRFAWLHKAMLDDEIEKVVMRS